jgi:hypothetical protein
MAAAAAVMGLWILSRIPTFHRAYTEHQQRLDDDEWLLVQCADPEFFTKMRRHASVCDDVRATFARPTWLVAFQACIPTAPVLGWQEVVLGGLVLLLAPSILLPILRAREEHWERQRIVDACSPMLVHPMLMQRRALPPPRADEI